MQHGTFLAVNLWLILQLVNYGQTDDICGAGKIRRGDKCCLSQLCVDTGFAPCTESNTQDTCVPCSEGLYLIGKYETSNFADPNVCAAIKECSPEEVKNGDGECVCDVSRGYYRIDEGICGLVQISCTSAGSQLSLQGHCDPCPEGYFKPVSGKQRCINKSNITCSSPEIILEGNTTTDRKCAKNADIMSTSTYSPPLSTYSNITNDDIDRNGNNGFFTGLLIGGLCAILFIIVLVVMLLVRCYRYYRRQQLQDLENNENVEDVAVELIVRRNSISDGQQFYLAEPYESSEDDTPNDVDNIDRSHTDKKVPYQSPQDNIPNVTGGPQVIGDNIGDDSHSSGVEVFTRDTSQTYAKVPYPSHGSSIDNVTGGPQVIGDNIGDDSHSSGMEVFTRDTSQTYAKVPYPSHGSSIDNAVRGDMPSCDEDNSDQKDRSFNPLPGDDRSCQCAVDGDIDGNDTASSINNDNDVNLLNCQPSSEHNSQPKKMVVGPLSLNLPVQNPAANLPHHLPHNHGGSSGENDSGFQD